MTSLQIGEALTVYEVATLKSEWLQGAKNASAVMLKADHVKEVDGAGLQLLVGLRKWIEHSGNTLSVVAPSPALVSAFDAVGLHDWLQQVVPESLESVL